MLLAPLRRRRSKSPANADDLLASIVPQVGSMAGVATDGSAVRRVRRRSKSPADAWPSRFHFTAVVPKLGPVQEADANSEVTGRLLRRSMSPANAPTLIAWSSPTDVKSTSAVCPSCDVTGGGRLRRRSKSPAGAAPPDCLSAAVPTPAPAEEARTVGRRRRSRSPAIEEALGGGAAQARRALISDCSEAAGALRQILANLELPEPSSQLHHSSGGAHQARPSQGFRSADGREPLGDRATGRKRAASPRPPSPQPASVRGHSQTAAGAASKAPAPAAEAAAQLELPAGRSSKRRR